MLNGHGDDLHLVEGEIKYNFSSNVFYKGCPSSLLKELRESLQCIENYPSPAASELNVLAAERYKLSKDHFLFTNGATEAFYLIAQLFKGKKTAILSPTFAEYEDACRIHGHDISRFSSINSVPVDADLVWICNPNNPDGSVISFDEIIHLVRSNSSTHFVIDEAYIEFTEATTTAILLTKEDKNISVVRSLTKTFTIPGLRLGYLVTSPELIEQILAIKMPWSVGSLAIKSGLFIFNNYDKLAFNRAKLLEETRVFQEQLAQIKWLSIVPGSTPYFLLRLMDRKAADLKKYLIIEHQLLVRDATNFKELRGQHVRISTQGTTANKKLIEALIEWN